MNDTVLVLNCGSSSIKFALFDADVYPVPRKPLWAGKVDGIGGTSIGRRTRRLQTSGRCVFCHEGGMSL